MIKNDQGRQAGRQARTHARTQVGRPSAEFKLPSFDILQLQ